MMGSGIYSLSVVVFVMLAKRLAGEEAGAQFYMAFTTGQMLLTIGYFEIRPFQVTDVSRQYAPSEYFGFRCITCLLMLAAGIAAGCFYVWNGKTDFGGFGLIMLLCVIKMMDGAADVFEGEFQRNERIDISGKSIAFRTLAVLLAFFAAAYLTHNIYAASAAAAIAAVLGAAAVGAVWHTHFEHLSVSFDKGRLKAMFRSTVLLFAGSAMCMWIWNGTKYVVEWNMAPHDILVYGIIFMPTMIINLGSGFVFKPMLTTMARDYENDDIRSFARLMCVLLACACALTLVTLAAMATVGIRVLEWLYAIELTPYIGEMMVLIAAGGFNAVSTILYYALMVMRKQVGIFAGYAAAFAVSIAIPVNMVRSYGLMGAAVSYLIVMTFLTVIFAAVTVGSLIKERGREKNQKSG